MASKLLTLLLTVPLIALSLFSSSGSAQEVQLIQELSLSGMQVTLLELPSQTFQLLIKREQGSWSKNEDDPVQTFTLENPLRLVVDVENKRAIKASSYRIDHPIIHQIRLGNHPGKSRIVIDISAQKPPSYRVQQDSISGEIKIQFSTLQKAVGVENKKKLDEPARREPELLAKTSAMHTQIIEEMPSALLPNSVDRQIAESLPAPQIPKSEPLKTKVDPTKIPPVKEQMSKKATTQKQTQSPRETKLPTPKDEVHSVTEAYVAKSDEVKLKSVESKVGFSKTPSVTHENQKPSLLAGLPAEKEEELLAEDELLRFEHPDIEIFRAMVESHSIPIDERKATEEERKNIKEASKELLGTTENDQILDQAIPTEPFQGTSRLPEQAFSVFDLLLPLLLCGLGVIFFLRKDSILLLVRHHPSEVSNLQLPLVEDPSPQLKESYRVLGCKESDSDKEIKQRYRHLVKVFHEDKLNSSDLPDEILEVTNEQFKKIQEAYETVCNSRAPNNLA